MEIPSDGASSPASSCSLDAEEQLFKLNCCRMEFNLPPLDQFGEEILDERRQRNFAGYSLADLVQSTSEIEIVTATAPGSPKGSHISSRFESEHRVVERRTESDMELVDETCDDIPRQSRASCSACASIVSIDSAELCDVSHHWANKGPEMIINKGPEMISRDEENALDTTDHVWEDYNSILKKKADLMNEIEYLKKQLLEYSNVHEKNVALSKEVEDLRRENLYLSLAHSKALCFEDRLQRLLDGTVDTEEQNTG